MAPLPSATIQNLSRRVRDAIESFIQILLDNTENQEDLATFSDKDHLAVILWREGLILAYRLLFILKIESLDDPGASFPFLSSARWRNEFSLGGGAVPVAVMPESRPCDGRSPEERIRSLLLVFAEGSAGPGVTIPAMRGTLFEKDRTATVDSLRWGASAVATLLDRLIWTGATRGAGAGDRFDYRALGVEDLGRVYESLFELEPGIATEPMCRLAGRRREIVVPRALGEAYRDATSSDVSWNEEIPENSFYLKTGVGRKAAGTFYTPTPLVRFLVDETLQPIVDDRCPAADPRPSEILRIRILDPATGSGHFLVEACRFLGRRLLGAIERCVDQGVETEFAWVVEGGADSEQMRERICRSLVVAHCLHGIDKNPLAVELTKLALWLEAAAPGHEALLSDQKVLTADFMTMPRIEELLTMPGSGDAIAPRLARSVLELAKRTPAAGARRLETAAAAWVGGVMLGPSASDDAAYRDLLRATTMQPAEEPGEALSVPPGLRTMIEAGGHAVPFELAFPAPFRGEGPAGRGPGFDAVIGNPPWEKLRVESRELLGEIDPAYLSGKESAGTTSARTRLHSDLDPASRHGKVIAYHRGINRLIRRAYPSAAWRVSGNIDAYKAFVTRSTQIASAEGRLGFVVGAAFAKTAADAALRRFLFEETGSLVCLLHFVNTNRQFDTLPSVFEFSAFVHSRTRTEDPARVVFNVDHVDVAAALAGRTLYSQAELSAMLRESGSLVPGMQVREAGGRQAITELAAAWGVDFGIDISRTQQDEERPLVSVGEIVPDALDAREPRVRDGLLRKGYVPAYTGKSMRMYQDFPVLKKGKWNPEAGLVGKLSHPKVQRCLGRMDHYRVAYRSTPGSPQTNERSFQVAMLPPGVLATNSVHPEMAPEGRPDAHALVALAILNSYCVDGSVRPHVTSNINRALLDMVRVQSFDVGEDEKRFLAHGALRLTAGHERFRMLWREQLRGEPESVLERALPALGDDGERLELRCAIDALVAHLFGLDRGEYERILRGFRHKEDPQAPSLCLARFEEIGSIGVDGFGRRYDPYWERMLNESAPKPSSFRSLGGID